MNVDVDAIESLAKDLSTITNEFEHANANSDAIAEQVGHPGLAGTVRDFAHKWDDRRKKINDKVKALSKASSAVADNWKDIDQQGADVLTGKGGD